MEETKDRRTDSPKTVSARSFMPNSSAPFPLKQTDMPMDETLVIS